jgi:hypothetical protein
LSERLVQLCERLRQLSERLCSLAKHLSALQARPYLLEERRTRGAARLTAFPSSP